ncbi:hypothetical protein BU26DRAFT_565737 [Trematosphaeria pertusa]|uniref:WSC domain-containing protein n=1 Tax=Trematosphaeria pertusa TaxID=390896 RepID=A0A6A6ICM2_9PLEO|nr:uncharacterized protein BU26DRAFT_565737 [Trematosphaeria pertusa]KAF2248334.1 hypothetical protein BU26DRAFT_565737 [Trematosphaeria pertusa]
MFAGLVALVALLLFAVPAKASFNAAYCSSQNTASNTSPQWHQWQSNGWCTTQCNNEGTYAFAVILDQNCWCSNYIPEDQEDTSECDEDCPGFPSEKCGNKDKNLYIYIKLDGSPSGTKGTSQPTSANSEISSETAAPTTLRTTATSSSEEVETIVPAPQTSIRIITESGRIVTQTVISTPTSEPVLTGGRKGSTNTGAIAGGVVGGLVVLAASIGGVFFFLWRRRKQQRRQEEEFQSGVQRNTSTMSKAGLLRGEKDPQYPPPIATNFTRRSSRIMLDNESISPISGSDRRNSRHMIDQRLNPSAVFVLDNSSRGSIASLDDSRDYHRALNVRNPDPDTH